MAKKASKSVQRNNSRMRITVWYGYALFLLSFIGIIITISPWFRWFAIHDKLTTNFQMTMLIISFLFTALAAPLVGYLAGDSATRSKNKLLHHYNGVLFGVLGVWVWLVLGMLVPLTWVIVPPTWPALTTFQFTLLNLAPTALAAIVTVVIGITYARKTRHQVTLIDYRPYRVTLISTVAALAPAIALSAAINGGWDNQFMIDFLIAMIVPLLFMLVAVVLGYWILGKKAGTTGERVVRSSVAAGFAIIAVTGGVQLIVSGDTSWEPVWQYLALGFAVIVWLSYLILIRRALAKK